MVQLLSATKRRRPRKPRLDGRGDFARINVCSSPVPDPDTLAAAPCLPSSMGPVAAADALPDSASPPGRRTMGRRPVVRRPATVLAMVAILDIDHFGRRLATVDQTDVGAVQFVQDAVCAGHAGNGFHRACHAGNGCRPSKAEQPGEECASIHEYLPISNLLSQSSTNRRRGRNTLP